MSNIVTINGKPIAGTLSDNAKTPQQAQLFKTFACGSQPANLNASLYQKRIQNLPVTVPSLINRDTEIKNLFKVVQETGGFDMRMWNPPRIARVKSTGEMYLFDGDHSRALYREYFPSAKTMPCEVIDVDTKADVHLLFIRFNAKCKTNISAEVIFVHEFHAGLVEAIADEARLRGAGLQVYCSHEPGGIVGDLNGMRVKIGAARKAFKIADLAQGQHKVAKGYTTAVRDAVQILKGAGLSSSQEDMIPAELLGGLTIVLSLFPSLRTSATGTDGDKFRKWVTLMIQGFSVKQFAANLKAEGGAVVNRSEFSVALGIVRMLTEQPPAPVLRGLTGKYPSGKSSVLVRCWGPKR